MDPTVRRLQILVSRYVGLAGEIGYGAFQRCGQPVEDEAVVDRSFPALDPTEV
jgi:hypothetical protein